MCAMLTLPESLDLRNAVCCECEWSVACVAVGRFRIVGLVLVFVASSMQIQISSTISFDFWGSLLSERGITFYLRGVAHFF